MGTINHDGRRRIATHRDAYSRSGGVREALDRELELLESMEIGGGGKDGDGENMGIIIPRPNARTYTAVMTYDLQH